MADDNMDIAKRLDAAVPIAQLGPDAPRGSAVHGMVTIVWPFNKVNNSVAFILAEPEARLRLAKGQIRVNCVGASAKAISECGLGSGDKVRLSLESVEFVANDAKARMPGTESEWQLSFSKRLILQAKVGYTEETKIIDVDASLEPDIEPPAPPSPVPEPEIELDVPVFISATPAKNASLQLKDGEFESPAFVKRARISYGGLFEGDPFEDDGGVKGKGRKRTRFSLDPRSWRYASRSPSPEESQEEEEEKEILRPQMADGECQTMELDFPEPLPEVISKPQGVSIPTSSTTTDQGHQTVSQGTWKTFEPQEPFTGAISSSPSKTAFDDPRLHAPEHVEWNEQPLPYPELPHAAPENPFASLDRPFDSQIPNGFGSDLLTQPDSFVHPNSFAFGDGLGSEIHGNQSHERTVYPDPDRYDSAKSASHVPMASPFAGPGVPLAEATVTVPADPYVRETSIPSERAAFNAGTSTWAAVNQTDDRSVSRPVSSRHSGDGQTPQSAMVIDESDSEEEARLVDAQYGSLGDAPVSHPDHVARTLEQAARNPLIEGPPPGHDVTEEDWEEVHAYADHPADRYDDEYDEDEEGGDYDTSNYLAPQDDEDDDDDMDLRQHRLEPEFNNGEEETSFDEEEYDEEENYGEEEEEEEEEVARMAPPQRPAQRPASSAPVVIDLLSDSDDDDDEPPPRPPPSAMPARPQLSMQAAVSPDYGPGSEESEVEEEEDDEGEEEEEEEEEGGEDDEEEEEESVGESEEVPTADADFDSDQEDLGIESEDGADEADETLEKDDRAEIPDLQSNRFQVGASAQAVPLRIALEPTEIGPDTKEPSVEESQPTKQDEQTDSIQQEPADAEQPSSIEAAREEEFQTIESENVPKVKSEPTIEAPSSPPLTQSFSSPISKVQDVVMEEAAAEILAPGYPLPTPADTQSRDIQPIETDMEMADVAESHPAVALVDVVDSTTTIVEEAVVLESAPEQAGSPRAQTESAVDALEAVPKVGAIEDVADELMEDAITVKEAVEDIKVSQLPPAAAELDLPFETQEGGQDILQAALDADSQPLTQAPAISGGYDFDDVVSLASQLSGDDALQAALREEDSRYYDSDGNDTMAMEVSQDQADETAKSEQSAEENVAASSPGDAQDQEMLVDEQATAETDAQDEPVPVSSPALAGSPPVEFQAEIQSEDHPEDQPETKSDPQGEILQETHESFPEFGADEHVNEAGIPMGSPEWTVKERHEPEEPNTRASSTTSRATPVTHKNQASLTVGSPERAAIERHQEEDAPHDTNSTPEAEMESFIGSPERAAMERHQHERTAPDEPKSKQIHETESFIGSPERAAIERHQEHKQVQEEKVPEVPETTPVQQKVEEFFIGSPEKTAKRRSQQKDQDSDDFTSDPSLRLARAAIASKNGNRVSPANSRPQTRSKSFQKSPTPELPDNSVQIARASLHTPSKTGRNEAPVASSPASSKVEEEASSQKDFRLKLVRHLRDQLPDCTPLKSVRQHPGKSVEVMAVAMMTPPTPVRAKGGPREYMMSFTITDHTIGPNSVSEVQLYRPHKESLPQVKHGDVVLLRNFTVVALKGKGHGLRTNDGSSWAVYDREDEPPQIKGPPVEYGDAETTFAAYLREWYGLLDDAAKVKLEKANQNIIKGGQTK